MTVIAQSKLGLYFKVFWQIAVNLFYQDLKLKKNVWIGWTGDVSRPYMEKVAQILKSLSSHLTY